MTLANPAQNKEFSATRLSLDKRAPSKRFSAPAKPLGKTFAAHRGLTPKQFPAPQFDAGEASANISPRPHLTKVETTYFASAVHRTHVAPESDATLAAAAFAGNRPFLGRGKSQKALSPRDTPLTIEQVRELLNKNK
jgi:hypothetical protein